MSQLDGIGHLNCFYRGMIIIKQSMFGQLAAFLQSYWMEDPFYQEWIQRIKFL